MKHALVFLWLLTPLVSLNATELNRNSHPNIILIYSDDHGFADLGALGADKDIRTPNLDALARDGVRFSHGYVSGPQCVPSRAGLMTGRYQQRFGVEDNSMGPLPLAELTMAERLKPVGYVSCQIGKWHLEPPPERSKKKDKKANDKEMSDRDFLPLGQGFDEYYTGPMNSFVASHDLNGNKLDNAPQTLVDKRFRCVWQTEAAVSFIDRHQQDPFFIYLAYFAPHVPLESPEPWFSQTPVHLPKERRQALSMIAAMDDGIGRIREKIRAQGNENNTLIFFIGDNGAPLKVGAWNGSLNLPLVGEKGMLTDGGVRTPFIATWPGTLPSQRVYDPAVINLDVAATAIAAAGLPHNESLDGVNLLPYLCDNKSGNPHSALFWRWRSQAAIRTDRWKLILLGKNQRYLFDLDGADGETELEKNNRINQFPEVAATLEKQLIEWDATLPPPGLPRDINDQDQMFYDAHVKLSGKSVKKLSQNSRAQGTENAVIKTAERTGSQGWIGRNCTLSVANGALNVHPDATSAVPFLALTGLDLDGPVTAILRVRCPSGEHGDWSWRVRGNKEFGEGQKTSFRLAATSDWQVIKVELPSKDHLIHVRLAFTAKTNTDIASITLQGMNTSISYDWSEK